MINEIADDLWAVGVSLIFLAFVLKFFFSKVGVVSKYYVENAEQLEKVGRDEYAAKLKEMNSTYTLRVDRYFRPLIAIGSVMVIAGLML